MAKEKEPRIEDTLKKLGISDDLPPEDVARDEGHAASLTTGEPLLKNVSLPDPDDDDEGGEEEEYEEEGSATNGNGLLSKEAQSAATRLEQAAQEQPALIPLPKAARGVPRGRSPVAGKMGKGLADKAPGAEKVKVYKRDMGRRWFVNDYTKFDLAQFPDFESFLTRYVKPEHGPGEYDLVGVDGLGREMELGQVRLIVPVKGQTAEGGAMTLVENMMKQQADRDEKWLSRMRETMQQPVQKDPIELLAGVMNLKKQLEGDAESGTSAAMKAMGEASSSTMQMMMLMMQQQQQAADRQNQLMMTILSKPKEEDPVMKMLLMKLVGDGASSGGNGGGLMPPPPPPPGPSIAELLTALGGFMASMGGGGGGDEDFKEFMKTLLMKQQSEQLGVKDVLQIVQKQQEQPGTDDFRRSVDNMAAIMNIAQTMNKSQEAGPTAGLFDALAALFSNRDFAGSIANTIRAKTDQSGSAEYQRIQAERQRLEMEKRMFSRERAQLAAAVQNAQQQGQPVQPPLNGATTVVPPAPVAVQAPVEPPPPTPAVSLEEVQRAAERVIERTGALPKLPALTHEHITRIAASTTDAELVSRSVALLIYFAESEDWSQFSEQLLGFVRDGDKRQTLQYLKAFFEGLTEMGMMKQELAHRVFKAIVGNLDALQAQLTDFQLPGDEVITGETLLAGAAEASPG